MESASSSSSRPRNEEHDAFSGIEPHGIRRKVEKSSKLFDVFINHRGPDVKLTVALQLYDSLRKLGIHTFLDSEEKELGDSFPSTIESAIHSASAHIAVFSNRYAESPWCLAELLLMLQSGAKIFPVFYGVKPSDLRHIEKGKYAKAFREYEEKRRYMEKLTEWKETLQSVSFITGYEISGNFNISDCQNIVLAVQKEVQSKKALHVAKYPVGLHRLVKDFERLCLDKVVEDFEKQCGTNEGGKEKAQVVGIFGMGGAGKTTLAKELFNRKRSQYTQACFLFDVREAYAVNSFPSLQMKFLKDLFGKDGLNFRSTEEGKTQIAGCIKRSKERSFLIVLDDIDHVQQLDALLLMDIQKKLVDSLVIVTTRDVGVLISTGISAAYNVKGMDRDHARELFCWHAFGQPHPANDYEKLVNSFLNVCGGLPLSLQVLGSHVHGRDQNYWSLELNKVSKILPRDIQQRLKISFDALDYEEQQIFIDIACFFIDKSKSVAMEVWQASGWSAQHALETLKNKCLVQEIEDGVIEGIRLKRSKGEENLALRMHDHLRDLGREMASALSRPSRLWRPQDLEYLESKGFQNIFAQTKGRCFNSLFDKSMRCQITYFVGESDVGADTSTCLLWLKLQYSHQPPRTSLQPYIPSWIPLQNLRYLIIHNPRHEKLWQSPAQMATKLKELHIYEASFMKNSSYLQELSVAHLSCLEKIVLHDCYGLKSVSGLSDLEKLIELKISNCQDLQELSVARLSCLEKIILDNCYRLKTVSGLSDLEKLIELDICNCRYLQELSVAHLRCLEKIVLKSCYRLKTMSGLSDLEKLIELKISNCQDLQELSVAHLSCLEKIILDNCYRLKTVSGLSDLEKLIELDISDCLDLQELSVAHLSCLEKIVLHNCYSLKWITIQSCDKLQTIQGIGKSKVIQLSGAQRPAMFCTSNLP